MPQGMDIRLLAVSVERQAQADLKERWNGRIFNYLGDTVMIAQLVQQEDISELTDECDRFCKYVNHVMGAKVTVGIGQVCENVQELVSSYQSAREAVSYRVLYGSNRAINMTEVEPQRRISKDGDEGNELSYLFKMICIGKIEDVGQAVEAYMQHNFMSQHSLENYHVAVMELISELYHFMSNNELNAQEISGSVGRLYNELSNFEPVVLKQWLLDFSSRLHDDMADARYNSKKSLIDSAKDYVHRNYRSVELGLDDTCKELGVSNSYFSSLFKKETGSSFVEYLTDYRMDKAARMLVETDDKSYVIAQNVGYADPNYFSYVFKRKYGVSPSRYRTEYEKNKV